jgi:hypothetical protein
LIRWDEQRSLPLGAAAVLGALQRDGDRAFPLSDAEWEKALAYADRFQLTLLLRVAAPPWVCRRIERDRLRNRERVRRILDAFRELRAAAGTETAVLKGFANWELFQSEPADRVQYDIDLFCPHDAPRLRQALPRPVDWKWNGDFYDPEMPVAIDLHAELWDERMEGFPAPGTEAFWDRRVWRSVEDLEFQTLAPIDAVAFATLHILRHLLHGDARPAQVYELSVFLDRHRHDDEFWREWLRLHPAGLRSLQAVAFRLAEEWFGCRMHEAARSAVAQLPPAVRNWFERYAASPVTSFFKPNKDELWLNLCLIPRGGAKVRVVRRRLFPARLPKPFGYALERGIFHLRALGPAVSTMLKMRR